MLIPTFRFIAVREIELRVFKKKKENMDNVTLSRSKHVKLPLDLIVCIQCILKVFSTVMSPKAALIENESRKPAFPYVWV